MTGSVWMAALALAPPGQGGGGQTGIPIVDSLLGLLADPNVAYLLFVLGLIGLIGELLTTGTVLPGMLGGISLILGLVGLGQLPTNWGGALLIVLALVLFLVDLKVPGNALSIGGIIAFALGSLLLFTPFWLVGSSKETVSLSPWVALGTTIGVGAFFVLGVTAALRSLSAPVAVGRETLVGKTGTVRQALCPEGIVHVEGEEWSAVAADGRQIPIGMQVRVLEATGLKLRVEPLPAGDLDEDYLIR